MDRTRVLPKYPNDLRLTNDVAKAAIRFANDIKEFVVNLINKYNLII